MCIRLMLLWLALTLSFQSRALYRHTRSSRRLCPTSPLWRLRKNLLTAPRTYLLSLKRTLEVLTARSQLTGTDCLPNSCNRYWRCRCLLLSFHFGRTSVLRGGLDFRKDDTFRP